MAEVTKLDPYKTINDKISGDIDDSLNKVIQRITSRSSDKWRELALKMIDPSKVTEITGKFQSTYDRYCEVFKVWLDTAADKRTWKQLTEILRKVDVFQSVAAEIERALPSSTEPSRSELRPTASTSTGDSKGNSKPKLVDLNKFVRPKVAKQWKDLGVELLSAVENGVGKLDIIGQNYPRDVETCCTEMFKHWLDNAADASWNKLVKALEVIGYNVLAKDLREKFC